MIVISTTVCLVLTFTTVTGSLHRGISPQCMEICRSCELEPTSNYGLCIVGCSRGVGPTCSPIDGGWSEWSDWVACDPMQCVGEIRTRTCDNPPPQFGGADCDGDAEETRQTCSATLLPISGKCMEIVTGGGVNYDTAEAGCIARGGQLASLTTRAIMDEFRDTFQSTLSAATWWRVGATEVGCVYTWVDGTPLPNDSPLWTAFDPDCDSEDYCVEYNNDSDGLEGFECVDAGDVDGGYVCEY